MHECTVVCLLCERWTKTVFKLSLTKSNYLSLVLSLFCFINGCEIIQQFTIIVTPHLVNCELVVYLDSVIYSDLIATHF